jgi:hypothetical protein
MKGKNVSFFLHCNDLLECDINLAISFEFLVQNLPIEDPNYTPRPSKNKPLFHPNDVFSKKEKLSNKDGEMFGEFFLVQIRLILL